MVAQNVCEFSHIVLSKPDVDLIALKCFLEINSDLGCHFGKLVSWQTRITSFSEEKILSLCKTEVAIH